MMSLSANTPYKLSLMVYKLLKVTAYATVPAVWLTLFLATPGVLESSFSYTVSPYIHYLQVVMYMQVFYAMALSADSFIKFWGSGVVYAFIFAFTGLPRVFPSYALAIYAVGLIIAYMAKSFSVGDLESLSNTLIEARRELKRIHWPSHAEAVKFAGIVAAFVSVSAIFWWVIDGFITRILSFLLQILS